MTMTCTVRSELRGEQRGKTSVVQKSFANPKEHREKRRAQGVHARDSQVPNTQ